MSLNKKKMAIFYCVAIFFILIDRFLKILALNIFQNREVNLIDGLLRFTFAKNYYIALSIPFGGLILEGLIGALILVLLYIFLKNYQQRPFLFAVILGAISNFYDRMKYGFVVDYLSLKWFSIFNLADAMIVCSIAIYLFLYYKKDYYSKE